MINKKMVTRDGYHKPIYATDPKVKKMRQERDFGVCIAHCGLLWRLYSRHQAHFLDIEPQFWAFYYIWKVLGTPAVNTRFPLIPIRSATEL
jgi:hypothetical protein